MDKCKAETLNVWTAEGMKFHCDEFRLLLLLLRTYKYAHNKRKTSIPIAYSTNARYAQPDRIAATVQARRRTTDSDAIAFKVKAIEKACSATLNT